MNKEFWNDVALKGAILGVIMLASHIFEQAMMLNGSSVQMAIVGGETLAVCIIYISMLYRFTKRYSQQFSAEEGFSFGKGFNYVLTLSLFTSIIVGLGGYIFTHFVIGYKEYTDGIVALYENLLSTTQIPAQMVGTYEQMLERIAEQPEPSILTTISSSIWSYIFGGAIVGLIIAGIVKREPNIFGDEQN